MVSQRTETFFWYWGFTSGTIGGFVAIVIFMAWLFEPLLIGVVPGHSTVIDWGSALVPLTFLALSIIHACECGAMILVHFEEKAGCYWY